MNAGEIKKLIQESTPLTIAHVNGETYHVPKPAYAHVFPSGKAVHVWDEKGGHETIPVSQITAVTPAARAAFSSPITFKGRELATMIAALRYWQREGLISSAREIDIASSGKRLKPLTAAEIDELCGKLNS